MNDHSHLIKEWDFEAAPVLERNARIFEVVAQHDGFRGEIHALEQGCADEVFTRVLAERCTSITACAISEVACTHAIRRCSGFSNVRIQQLDLGHN